MKNFCLAIEMIFECELKSRCWDFHHILSVILEITSVRCGDLLKHELRFPCLTVAKFFWEKKKPTTNKQFKNQQNQTNQNIAGVE